MLQFIDTYNIHNVYNNISQNFNEVERRLNSLEQQGEGNNVRPVLEQLVSTVAMLEIRIRELEQKLGEFRLIYQIT